MMKKDMVSMVFTSIITLVIVLAIYLAIDFPRMAALYPLVVCSMSLLPCLLLLVADIRRAVAGRSSERGGGIASDIETEFGMPTSVVTRRFVRTWAWILGLYGLIVLVGFKVALTVFFAVYLTTQAHTRWYKTLILTAIAAVFLIYIDMVLRAYWPEGLLKQWLPWLP